MAYNETYEEFTEKFKLKKTTDDCYTPDNIYEIIKDWAVNEYNLQNMNVVRPFYPGGDYQSYDYKINDVVIDNPPFSILSKIISFYLDKNIKFFLFCDGKTIYSKKYTEEQYKKITFIPLNATITYVNKANVNTSFITNMDNCLIRTAPKLYKVILFENNKTENKKKLPKYIYPDNLLRSHSLNDLNQNNVDFKVDFSEVHYLRALDKQKKIKKTIYGSGFFISDKKLKEKQEIENKLLKENKIKKTNYVGTF
ncbi:hypothetical protein B7939_01060 [Eggerthia catenaformis]|nr:hypothetical protein B7939_01060 [Eggerthia catenaformis]